MQQNLILSVLATAVSIVIAAPAIYKRDGDYYSEVVLQPGGLVLDFPTPNGQPSPEYTQLQICTETGGDNQFFKFVPTDQYGDDNYYNIIHYQTGYCVDALSFGTDNGAAVGLYHCNGKENQIWSLNPVNGGYFIVSMMSNRCLNDLGGARNSGDQVGLWDCSTDPQYYDNYVWNINEVAIGHFWSQLGSSNNLVLDFPSFNGPSAPGTQLQLYSSNGGQAQQFRFEPTDDGYFTVINQETGYCLDVSNSAIDNGSPVALFTCNGQDNQKWSVNSKGLYASGIPAWVVAKQSGRCLNDHGGQFNQGDQIVIWDCVENDPASVWGINYPAFPNKNLVKNGRDGIQNVEIVLVLWGNVNYADQYPDFYQTLLSSPVFQMLGQYGVYSGSYQGYIQLPPNGGPPLPSNNNPDIGAYLHQLTQDGYLQPNANTYYAVHFAPDSGVTCNGYCGYHSGVWVGDVPNQATNESIYGVLPDLNNCGCGGNSVFESQTMAAAHELIEAVTDPWGGYRDPVTEAEIGDLCSYRTYSISGSSGNSYVIQKMWSNVANTCVE
ncbi:hypothetical protein HDU76_004047 [Blyttiomyces sp. JEL0837]|nr:hypothetical protein HDU76_004047 [Blyttiomyces sp. JEL0837]